MCYGNRLSTLRCLSHAARHGCRPGGVLPIVPLLRELLHPAYTGELQLEYEVEPKDPLPGMAESLGFLRGTLQAAS